jgi:hypothetical protein
MVDLKSIKILRDLNREELDSIKMFTQEKFLKA